MITQESPCKAGGSFLLIPATVYRADGVRIYRYEYKLIWFTEGGRRYTVSIQIIKGGE